MSNQTWVLCADAALIANSLAGEGPDPSEFRAARFEASGRKTANARVGIEQNGVVVRDNIELPKVTGGAYHENENPPGGLMLQDHGHPVRFANIRVERLD